LSDIVTRRALMLRQADGNPLYLFALYPAEVQRIAGISRIGRGDGHNLIGYQRIEIRQHVDEIRDYLDQGSVIFPNAIILAFEDELSFMRSRGPSTEDGLAVSGRLEIEIPDEGRPRPAWIVDGQQRAIALAATTNQDMAIPVAAIDQAGLELQRDQFLRINNARPLARSLVNELLPDVDTFLPRRLAASKLSSAIAGVLNRHPESPFRNLIKRPSTPKEKKRRAVITDSSVVDMLRGRLHEASGCLFPFRNEATGETDTDMVMSVLVAYWSAVRDVFPDAWGVSPRKSRLMHGVGIKSMGHLMDTILPRMNPYHDDVLLRSREEIERIAPICRWTEGTWEGMGNIPWNQPENTPRSVKLLSNHLVREYSKALHIR
jgi:DGQHR domain-containing protein